MRLDRVLITGSAGLIGRYVTSALRGSSTNVLACDSLIHGQRPNADVAFEQWDLRDERTASRICAFAPDAVIHLAGLAEIARCETHVGEAFEANVTATANVIRALDRKPATLIIASSAAVYATGPHRHKETEPCLPNTVYGTTKLLSEVLVRQYAERTSAPTVIMRLASVYGCRDMIDRVVPAILRQVRAGVPDLQLGNLSARRDFVHANDVANVASWFAVNADSLDVVNIGTGKAIAVSELVECFQAVLGDSIRVAPPPAGRVDTADIVALDVSKLQAMIPDPTPTDLRAGIALLLETDSPHDLALDP